MTIIAIDTETTGPDFQHGCKPFYVSIADDDENIYGYSSPVDAFTREVKVSPSIVKELKKIIKDADKIVFHNAKFDIKALASIGIDVPFHKVEDTHLMSHVMNSESKHGLKELAEEYLNITTDDQYDLNVIVNQARRLAKRYGMDIARPNHPHFPSTKQPRGKGWWVMDMWLPQEIINYEKKNNIDHSFPEKEWNSVCETYALTDAARTLGLYIFFEKVLSSGGMLSQYNLNKKLLAVTYEMETKGITLKHDALIKEIKRYQAEIDHHFGIAKNIGNKYINDINLNSSKQLTELFYDIWKMQVVRVTKNGNPATDADTLMELRESQSKKSTAYKFITNLIIGKKFQTAKNYLQGYQDALANDRLYPHYNLVGTSTTRFSSSNPNAQNIGKGTDPFMDEMKNAGLNLRKVFGPTKGKIWYALDYSQLQLRIFASVSGEHDLIQAFDDGYDAHDYMARRIFDIPDHKEPTSGQRRIAKNVNFGFIFGASPRKIEQTAKISGLWDTITSMFPNAHAFIEKTKKQINKYGFVYTAGGYPLTCDSAHKGVNYIVQGTEGEIVKRAMVECDKHIKKQYPDCRIIMQVHDEIIFETDKYTSQQFAIEMKRQMEKAGLFYGIDTPVDIELITDNWSKGEKLDV